MNISKLKYIQCNIFFIGLNMVNNRSRPEHMYPIGYTNSSSTQTAMECEPVPMMNSSHQRHGHQHRATHRYQPPRSSALMNYAPCSLPTETMSGYYQPYSGQRSYTGLTNQDGTSGKMQTTSSSSNNQTERDDSPMVGVCVQQSPVAIH